MDIDAIREVWNFFTAIKPETPGNPADLNGDGDTNALDIGDLLAAWTG